MADKQNPSGNRHMTEEQKTVLLSLFDQCHMAELLLTIGGIVSNRVNGFEASQDARKCIMEARRIVLKHGAQ